MDNRIILFIKQIVSLTIVMPPSFRCNEDITSPPDNKTHGEITGFSSTLQFLAFVLLFISFSVNLKATGARETINLSDFQWKVWMDGTALWKEDKLYLPSEVNLSSLPVNPPTCGWKEMYLNKGTACSIPATIEEIFSGGINSWVYRGVSWFWTEIEFPDNWAGKKIEIQVEKARMRMEIYVNEQLCGYDLVAETPYSCDISENVRLGEKNRIAIRLTNPGGRRGWEDFPGISWGKYKFPSSHDFTGIGNVVIETKNQLFIQDIFVKNLLPGENRKIEVVATIFNPGEISKKINFEIDISSIKDKKENIFKIQWKQNLTTGLNTINKQITVKEAKLWDLENPNLYRCRTRMTENEIVDEHSVEFGFRSFEIKEENGNPGFYVNGKRVRFRSAIDWGYYALTGFYATPEMAEKSVRAAKDVGHNAINFHRRIGEPLVMDYADDLGLFIYEEPGGFHVGGQGYLISEGSFAGEIMLEKIRRMVIRDRNHPALLWYTLCNEDNYFNPLRKRALLMIRELDETRLISNSSGWNWRGTEYFRPYDPTLRNDLVDIHTVGNKARFQDSDLSSHQTDDDSSLVYWGEVRCYTGPPNWYKVAKMQGNMAGGKTGYDLNIYQPLKQKIEDFFQSGDFPNAGSKNIKTPDDLTIQAGRGLMYADARLGQTIMSNNNNDGYAINGWSPGPQLPDEWESAILDEARNLKGPATDFKFWVKDNQIAIFRQNGKYFKVGDKIQFKIKLINERKIERGEYELKLTVTDGSGTQVAQPYAQNVFVEGGDVYAQNLISKFELLTNENWKAGYITLHGYLLRGEDTISSGSEQVLLQNRPSYQNDFKDIKGMVFNWEAAKKAIYETGNMVQDFNVSADKVDYILAGPVFDWKGYKIEGPVRNIPHPSYSLTDNEFRDIIERVKNDGTLLVIQGDFRWAEYLFDKGILSELHYDRGGSQADGWNGNGWGYIDYYCGKEAIPSVSTISTNSWEVPKDPQGYYPIKSKFPLKIYGAYFARPYRILVTLCSIKYGKGTIIINFSYPVDDNNAFNDLLFYNLILMSKN